MNFKEKWLEAVDKKNSVLCAGLDPAEFNMGRGEKGLPEGVNKRDWALKYVEAVAPYSAVLKPNIQYWKSSGGDIDTLVEAKGLADSLGMIVIDDSKLADIGSTNDAGIFYAIPRADAVTIAPYAGNMEEASKMAKARDVGAITMCIMSNPEYEREKNMLVPILEGEEESYPSAFLIRSPIAGDDKLYTPRYIQLAHDAQKYGLDGVVIGAPSKKNHIKNAEIDNVRNLIGDDRLVLLPGLGAQGGEADAIWKYFGKDKVICNVGRSLMLPNGSNSSPEEQAETAKHYQKMLNDRRTN